MKPHGWQRYRRGCRCATCTTDHAAHAREYRARAGTRRYASQVAAEQRYEQKRKVARRAKRLTGATVKVVGRRVNRLEG